MAPAADGNGSVSRDERPPDDSMPVELVCVALVVLVLLVALLAASAWFTRVVNDPASW